MRTIERILAHMNAQATDGIVSEVLFATPPKANVLLGDTHDGNIAALLITPSAFTFDVVGRNVREVVEVSVYFLKPQPQLDFDAVENMVHQDSCIAAALDMYRRVIDDRFFVVEKNTVASALMYDVNNRNLTGVRLSLVLHERKGICIDGEQPNKEDRDFLPF